MAKQGTRFASIPDYLANSRIHSGAKIIYKRDDVFRASMRLLQQHYGYVPFPWIFGYTAYRMDGRDQFFQPLEPTFRKYLASLPMGLRMDPSRRLRFLGEWMTAPLGFSKRGGGVRAAGIQHLVCGARRDEPKGAIAER